MHNKHSLSHLIAIAIICSYCTKILVANLDKKRGLLEHKYVACLIAVQTQQKQHREYCFLNQRQFSSAR
jgi:hypothetical protein